MKALDWRDIHVAEPVGRRRKDRVARVRGWLLRSDAWYWALVLLAAAITFVVCWQVG